MVNTGKIECAFSYPQTDPNVTVPITIYYSGINFLYKKSRFPGGVNFTKLSELKDYKIGALTGSKWSKKLFQKDAGLKLDFAPTYELNIKKLYAERIDLLPLVDVTALPLLESVYPEIKEEFGLSKPFSITSYCLIFSNKYPDCEDVIDDIRTKLEQIDLQEILQKHYGQYYPNGVIPSYMTTGHISN